MRTLRVVLSLAALGTAVIVPGLQRADAYETYSENGDATNCRSCHGDFRASPYTSLKPGEGDWSSSLHNVHRYDMLEGDCDVCHGGLGGSRLPVSIYSSDGGLGLPAIGCIGCHGRDAGGGSTGVGLRQKHFRAGQTLCVTCHSDSDPAQAIPVGENTMPAYYFTPDSNHPNKPTDPCNPGSAFVEGRYGASSLGLDNDGDGAYDANDTDCQATVATPGEANGMQVTNFDGQTGQITVSYTPGCSTSDNTIEYGLLAELSAYAYEGQVCAIANTGSATFTLPSGSYFFLVVGNDGANEGSYGLGVGEAERPEDSTSASCPLPQDLSQRCD